VAHLSSSSLPAQFAWAFHHDRSRPGPDVLDQDEDNRSLMCHPAC
jgi:hypothetical protein